MNLENRITMLETAMDAGQPKQRIAVVLVNDESDLAISENLDDWVSRDEQIAEARPGPTGVTIAYLDCTRERAARALQD